MRRLASGKIVRMFGNPDTRHSYTYVSDVVSTLEALGATTETGELAAHPIWHVPTAEAITSREFFTELGDALGVQARVRQLPSWLLRAIGVAVPIATEVHEMLYQWERSFVIASSRSERVLGLTATPIAAAVAEVAASLVPAKQLVSTSLSPAE